MTKNINESFSPELKKQLKKVDINFFKLSGTWDMIERNGRKIGSGNLDDDELRKIQNELGYFSKNLQERIIAEIKLVKKLYANFQEVNTKEYDAGRHLSHWAKNKKTGEQFDDFVKGPFIPLFSGDSSHLTNCVIAPMITILIKKAIEEPTKPILGGQGTDTADMALLQLYDALTFDTELPPLILTGANRAWYEKDSDASENFINLGKLAHINLDPGAYWVFQGNIYKASDFVKIDPRESRRIEEQSTFYAPYQKQNNLNVFLKNGDKAKWESRKSPSIEHIVHKITAESLYDAAESVYTYDLGDGNSIPKSMLAYTDPKNKAIIIAAHSLGNVNNATKQDAINAAREGKLVIVVSRTLIGDISNEYGASLLSANNNPKELSGTGNIIISAAKLNKSGTSHALAVRAVFENLNQAQTQKLFNNYAHSRGLI